jgi:hypothetical protein
MEAELLFLDPANVNPCVAALIEQTEIVAGTSKRRMVRGSQATTRKRLRRHAMTDQQSNPRPSPANVIEKHRRRRRRDLSND